MPRASQNDERAWQLKDHGIKYACKQTSERPTCETLDDIRWSNSS